VLAHAGQFFLGEPRQARRPTADPGGRGPRLGCMRPSPLLRAAAGHHAQTVLRPRAPPADGLR
jgi:hypothetical protein